MNAKKGKLKAAIKWGVGTDNIDFDAFKKLEIPVTNTPNMFGDEVAELAMLFILGLSRDAFIQIEELGIMIGQNQLVLA